MDWGFIDKVVYINLARRTDRKEKMDEFIKPFGDKVIRFEAIEKIPGWLGCSLSHIEVLKLAIKNQWKNVLILEDDCEWNHTTYGYDSLTKLIKNPYDVILLGGSWSQVDIDTSKLKYSQGTSSYLVNSNYYKTLLDNFEEGAAMFQSDGHYKYTIDRYWNTLIKSDNWFLIVPNLIYQRPDFSDNVQEFMNYTDCFMINISEITNTKRAVWGTRKRMVNVIDTIKSLPTNKLLRLEYTLFPEDPDPGKTKSLNVLQNQKCITIRENDIFIIKNGNS